MPDTLTVNDAEFTVIRLLGKGKGGYSYLVTDGKENFVLKQIHHESCAYYTFGDKLASEPRDYAALRELGIPMPRLLAVDRRQERLLKEYIPGPTVAELVEVSGDRFEYETNMLLAFKEKAIPFEENKIRTVYIEENKSSHFRTFVDSWRIYKLILAHFFRYTINSIVCAAADTGWSR